MPGPGQEESRSLRAARQIYEENTNSVKTVKNVWSGEEECRSAEGLL